MSVTGVTDDVEIIVLFDATLTTAVDVIVALDVTPGPVDATDEVICPLDTALIDVTDGAVVEVIKTEACSLLDVAWTDGADVTSPLDDELVNPNDNIEVP